MRRTFILSRSLKELETFTSSESLTLYSRDGKYQTGLNQASEKDTILIHMQERCGIRQFLSADMNRPLLHKSPNLSVQTSSTCLSTETMQEVKEQEFSTTKIQNQLSTDTKEDLNLRTKRDSFHSKMLTKTLTSKRSLELTQTLLKVNRNSLTSSLFREKQRPGSMKNIAKPISSDRLNTDLKNPTSNECGITTEPTISSNCSQSSSKMDRSPLMTLTLQNSSLTKTDFPVPLFST